MTNKFYREFKKLADKHGFPIMFINEMDNPINVDEDYSNIEIYEIGFERKGGK
jgi:hypothetical protein|tara:strand:- start:592 stop:750 length:159 start_codon:yes stop_codon:yes gene_type:complete